MSPTILTESLAKVSYSQSSVTVAYEGLSSIQTSSIHSIAEMQIAGKHTTNWPENFDLVSSDDRSFSNQLLSSSISLQNDRFKDLFITLTIGNADILPSKTSIKIEKKSIVTSTSAAMEVDNPYLFSQSMVSATPTVSSIDLALCIYSLL